MTARPDPLIVHVFPCLSDNYGFLIHDPASAQTACVDTPDADAIDRELEKCGWRLTHILNTHHHWDHAGGNLQLKAAHGCTIVGAAHDAERIPGIDIRVQEGDVFQFGQHDFRVLETPGHTSGHIVYYVPDQRLLFAGDTIFSAGCGRLFEGSPGQMWHSLKKIKDLPEDTQIYCAHEYTLNNLEFARTLDRHNPDLEAYYTEVKKLRSENRPTIPTILRLELKVNPFLHPGSDGIRPNLTDPSADEVACFTDIRRRKDSF